MFMYCFFFFQHGLTNYYVDPTLSARASDPTAVLCFSPKHSTPTSHRAHRANIIELSLTLTAKHQPNILPERQTDGRTRARTHAHTHARTRARTHAHTHARTHARTDGRTDRQTGQGAYNNISALRQTN